jgi:hypothetical protein
LFEETVFGVLGSYTVDGRKGSEGSLGGAVTDDVGGWGERGLARRWGLDAGEREEECEVLCRDGEELGCEGEDGCAATPLSSVGLLEMLWFRWEVEVVWAWPFSLPCCDDLVLLAVVD